MDGSNTTERGASRDIKVREEGARERGMGYGVRGAEGSDPL